MTKSISLPLQEKISRNSTLHRAMSLVISFLLLSLLFYRFTSLSSHGVVWLLAFLCESWFTLVWFITTIPKWNLIKYKTYPERLLQRFPELPPLDMFVTTADPLLEPPIIIVNTVLSLLAVDYPSHKLACFVSDDGGSPITFYSLVEASKFAKLWVPFCKKYDIQVRAPFVYFSTEPETYNGVPSDFARERRKIKNEYEELSRRIAEAVQNSVPCHLSDDYAEFSKIERGNHPSIVKVIWENKENLEDGVPHLIYVAREKRPKHPHHYKAGAMNALVRVSGVMTNAPFMLNVDCDMFVNNPQTVLHAMCLLLGSENDQKCAFAQFPQKMYNGLKDDPFGNHMIVLQEYILHGLAGVQGPFYCGSGCFNKRKVIYGLKPHDNEMIGKKFDLMNDKSEKEFLQRRFGYSTEFLESAAVTMSGKNEQIPSLSGLSSSLEAAKRVSGCNYEGNTAWGKEIGLVYGSTTEDVLTGLRIHKLGWETTYCTPDPPAFLGCAPTGGPDSMIQQKRWATGTLEVLVGENSPLIAMFTTKIKFRQCLGYLVINVWALRSLPELCYAALPAYCLLTNATIFPKVSEPAIFIPATLFIIFKLYTLIEYFNCGLSVRTWWNNQRMQRIISVTAWSFGLLGVILKLLGISETVFEVTRKDESAPHPNADVDPGRFTFNSSPLFVPGTALVLVHMTALFIWLVRVQPGVHGESGSGLGEVVCSVWILLSFLPFLKGFLGKGKYGIPWSTVCKGAVLALLFFHSCKRASADLENY